MFEFSNKNVVSEVGGTMRIIGDRNSKLCLLKDKDGPLYAGWFCDCEYVAAVITECRYGQYLPLYFDRQFRPCGAEDAVRSITPNGFRCYELKVLYEVHDGPIGALETCLRTLLFNYSPFSITKYTKDGVPTIDRYNKMVLHDRRSDTGMCIAFTHGVRLLSSGLVDDALLAVGGKCAANMSMDRQTAPIENAMGSDPWWAWNLRGDVCSSVAFLRDPDAVLAATYEERGVIRFHPPAAYIVRNLVEVATKEPEKLASQLVFYCDSMRRTYEKAGIDKVADVDTFEDKVKMRLKYEGFEI